MACDGLKSASGKWEIGGRYKKDSQEAKEYSSRQKRFHSSMPG